MLKQENLKSSEIRLLSSNSPENFNKSNKRILRYYTSHFSFSCRIASVTSYLCENEAENLQNGDFHLAQIPGFGMRFLENHLAY